MKYRKALTFSYDDGIEQDRKLVEIFNRYGMKATFNLNTGIQSPESNFEIEGVHINRMKQDGLAELYKGHEIATHGLTHAAPTDMTKEELDKEFITDMKNIERIYGTYPVGMAYAYGCVNDTVAEYLKSIGIKYGRTVESSHSFEIPKEPIKLKATCHHDDEMLFELAEKFIKAEPMFTGDEWMIPKKYVKVIGDTVVFDYSIFFEIMITNRRSRIYNSVMAFTSVPSRNYIYGFSVR